MDKVPFILRNITFFGSPGHFFIVLEDNAAGPRGETRTEVNKDKLPRGYPKPRLVSSVLIDHTIASGVRVFKAIVIGVSRAIGD